MIQGIGWDDPILAGVEIARKAQAAEYAFLGSTRPRYHFEGRTLAWGEDISSEHMCSMLEDAEVFVLLDEEGHAYSLLLRDMLGNLRERKLRGSA